MQYRNRVAETLAEPRDDLRRERDLRHEHDRAASLLERGRGCAEVDLGLARARDAVQQAPFGAPLAEDCEQRLERGPLLGRELRCERPAHPHRQVLGRSAAAAPAPAQPAGGARRQHQGEGACGRRAVFLRDPAGELNEVGGNAELQRAQRREQPLGCDLAAVGEPDDHTEDLAAAERHDEHGSDLNSVLTELLGQPVVEGPAQRTGRRHRLDLGDRGHRPDPRASLGQRPAAARSACALSVRSHVKSWSARPKCP